MHAREETDLTANEVAVLSGVSPRAVRKAIEERVLTFGEARLPALGRTVRKALGAHAPAFMYIMREIRWPMPVEGRIRIARWLRDTEPDEIRGHLAIDGPLFLDVEQLAPKIRAVRKRTARYRHARNEWIVRDKGVMGGTPVIKGTRVTVYSLLGRIEAGETTDEINSEYPDIPPEAIEAAIIFAKANPMRGRPSGRPWTKAA